jgi:hypothetical protein
MSSFTLTQSNPTSNVLQSDGGPKNLTIYSEGNGSVFGNAYLQVLISPPLPTPIFQAMQINGTVIPVTYAAGTNVPILYVPCGFLIKLEIIGATSTTSISGILQ